MMYVIDFLLALFTFPFFLVVNIYLAWRRMWLYSSAGYAKYACFFLWYWEGVLDYWDLDG